MIEEDKRIIQEFKSRLPDHIKAHLTRLVVFGSRARGEPLEDSDLDLIALVDRKTGRLEKELEDVAYQVMWNHDFKPIISLKVFEESRFKRAVRRGFSFYRRVEKEGIPV